jgi:leader peptidase (prepilin peptidase)/N-methyltransferase
VLEIFIFIFGLIAGSFANVCIYRLPREESIIRPPSHCPSCGKNILWYDNIPILSFIFLKGRCRSCKNPISFRYPLVEFLTAFLFLMTFRFTGISPALFFLWYFFVLLIIAAFTDFAQLIIPDCVSIPGMAIGVIAAFVFPGLMKAASHPEGFLRSFAGLLAGGGVIWIIGFLGKALFKKEAMGGGDVKLMGMVGSFLGIKLTFLTIFLGSLFGASVGGILILLRLKTRKDYIPFGPYLALGAVSSFFWGEKILNWYFALLSF